MKKEQGFTLVELLAVLVILGIIGTIAMPIVLDYVKDSKEKSFETSLDNISRASKLYFTDNQIKNSTMLDLTTGVVKLGGEKITKGYAVGNRKNVNVYIYKNGFCGVKNGNNVTIKKTSEQECNWSIDSSIKVASSNKITKDQIIKGYRIYGNTVNNTNLGDNNTIVLKLNGKNLFDKRQSAHQGIRDEIPFSIWAATTLDNTWVKNTLKPSTKYTITFNADCLSIPEHDTQASGNFGFLLYSGISGYGAFWFNITNKYFTVNESYVSNRTITTPANLYDSAANFRILAYTNRYLKDNVGVYSTMKYSNIQIEEGDVATPYEPYLEPKEYTITLSEPLRKYGTKVDYIDSSINQIVRNVGVRADGTLYELDKPTYEYIKLPSITNLDGTTIISASDGSLQPSSLEVLLAN